MEQTANNWPGLAEKILGILCCLSCGDGLRNEAEGVVCSGCARKYPLVNRVVRFVDTQHYAGSFGFQGKLYARTQLDNEQSRSMPFPGALDLLPRILRVNWSWMWGAGWGDLPRSRSAGSPCSGH